MSSSSNSGVKGLRVFHSTRQEFKELRPGTTLFSCTAGVVGLALDLLGCKSSVSALKSITRKIVETNMHIPELRNLQESHIGPKVDEYLAKVGGSFPHVVITNQHGMAAKNGRTNKRDCSGVFEPKTAAVIEINETLLSRMADAFRVLQSKKSQTYAQHFQTLHFRLSVTVAHELVHVYNLFLRRGRSYHTPPHVTYGGYGDREAGESGRYWEYFVLGGFVDMREANRKPPENLEVVAIRDSHRVKVWRIRTKVIADILGRNIETHLKIGVPLNDSDHEKGKYTELMSTLDWKNGFRDIFPAVSQSEQNQELSQERIAWLTGPGALNLPMFNIDQNALMEFSVRPRIQIPCA